MLETFLPGFLSGVTRVLISYPADYVRVFLQKGEYDSALQYLTKNGVRGVYRGVHYPLCIIPFDRAITFKLYEDLNKRMNPAYSSFLVSLLTCSYNVPIQSINTNYILQQRRERFLSNYRSLFVEYSRLVIGSTIYMGVYGNLRSRTDSNFYNHMINGIVANLSSWTIMYPLDTIRVEHSTNTWSICDTIQDKYRRTGLKGFYSGIKLVYLRTIPSAGIGMLVYETTRKYIS
ncbi:MAG: hypothetical protein Solivirus3_38 [Solivirus sp.]|uniref:Mitochondrial carrier protein n=1 Tax=Solivirus sp. TaxID=2487772 RepID=A0A3G5AFY4_9VIRU|nr:MAG: hypothetical protein Solivirus3_38 [Solivirus sp.]